jgi:hypothetical protein
VLVHVRRRRHSLENEPALQMLWLQRAVVGCLVGGLFGTYSGLTMFYLFLGTLWASANVLSNDTPTAGLRLVRPAMRAR